MANLLAEFEKIDEVHKFDYKICTNWQMLTEFLRIVVEVTSNVFESNYVYSSRESQQASPAAGAADKTGSTRS